MLQRGNGHGFLDVRAVPERTTLYNPIPQDLDTPPLSFKITCVAIRPRNFLLRR
jgi:hypothetical protein